MHPLLSSTKQVTAIAITQMGQSSVPSPLTPAQKAALTLIANELTQFMASGAPASPPGRPPGLDRSSGLREFFEEALVALDCAAAAAEGGREIHSPTPHALVASPWWSRRRTMTVQETTDGLGPTPAMAPATALIVEAVEMMTATVAMMGAPQAEPMTPEATKEPS